MSGWSAERRAQYEATIKARRNRTKCDICSHAPAQRFSLTHARQDIRSGRFDQHGAGSIYLCRWCWTHTAAKRRRASAPRSRPRLRAVS